MDSLYAELDSVCLTVLGLIPDGKLDITHEFVPGDGFVRIYNAGFGIIRQLELIMTDGSRFVFNKVLDLYFANDIFYEKK
jgi:hypothetical protein